MGTRGLWAYRWRRRYYTTYNHWDSYPSGLGSDLVAKIPSDPDEFARWLAALKKKLQARHDGETEAPKLDLFIEWTYVIDLDRNAFTVNGNSHVQLDKLPRGEDADEWTVALNRDHPASMELSSPIEPSAEHIALYDAVHASESPVSTIPEFEFSTCGVLMDQFFRNFCFVYDPRVIAEEQPNTATFLAAARGIVALATWGDFDLTAQPLTERHTYRERSDIDPEWSGPSSKTHFWHRGVLFVLDSGLEDASQLRGAVGRVVHLWRECKDARKRTIAFVITLRDLVQIDLSDDQNVKHTALLPLASRDLQAPSADDDDDDYPSRISGFPVKMKFTPTSPAFAMLKTTLTPELPASSPSDLSGPFPLDVIERLLDWCDTDTLASLSETCKSMRTLWLNRPRLDVGPYRLLHSVGNGIFTALDAYGDTTSVLVGGLRFDDYEKEGGSGYNLRLFVGGRKKRVGTVAKLIGLSACGAENDSAP
ncbi:hypothetical protein EXIGLDRAFT_728575 [Exidia glandulosa HHB12029]|uniref:F-box domain-containing protein n=1 Tax=Exidia glandulosa HHB12029 TaxID=1314781 RepID=A0A165Q3V6_EXIGL|nr:hypothetical protein EXIGLDRAFT_728575 [Exidia glandulosa HHB12029]